MKNWPSEDSLGKRGLFIRRDKDLHNLLMTNFQVFKI